LSIAPDPLLIPAKVGDAPEPSSGRCEGSGAHKWELSQSSGSRAGDKTARGAALKDAAGTETEQAGSAGKRRAATRETLDGFMVLILRLLYEKLWVETEWDRSDSAENLADSGPREFSISNRFARR
jgi:hypothetical protein